jgi:hypothetical protein
LIAFGMGFACIATASADENDGNSPGVAVNTVDGDATSAPAVTACGAFGQALDGASTYYGSFADSYEGSDYADPAVDQSNSTGRTALRQASSVAMQAAGTPALLVKMGLRIPGDSLNSTATSMNTQAEQAQQACAAAGTHA